MNVNMAVLSTLNRVRSFSKNLIQLSKVSKPCALKSNIGVMTTLVRNAGGGQVERSMVIQPSNFAFRKFVDDLHFYTLLGVIPLGILIFLVNVFIGPAELAEIPEGYVPKHWEYYKHPITRFFARYFERDPQLCYEMTLHNLKELQETAEFRVLFTKVEDLQRERDDYKGWYYIPSQQGKYHRMARKQTDEMEKKLGFQ